MINAAIVGLGRWGKALVNAVQGKSDAIRFVKGVTRTRASAEDFARDKGFTLVDSYDEILADPAIGAVVIATPHSQHADQVRRAIAAGKHILVEKPITLERASAGNPGQGGAEGRTWCSRSASAAVFIPRSATSAPSRGRQARQGHEHDARPIPPAPASSSRRTTGAPTRPKRRPAGSPPSACT